MDDPRLIKKLLKTITSVDGQSVSSYHPLGKKVDALVSMLLDSVSYKMGGFFIEFGAGDGVTMSPTLKLEKQYKWNGLLVEAEEKTARELITKRKRSSYFSNSCVGTYNKSYTAFFGVRKNFGSKLVGDQWESFDYIYEVYCYPLYTYLLAMKRTNVDLIIIDINKNELGVLSVVPFDKVHIDVLVVRYRTLEELKNITGFLLLRNYKILDIQKKIRYIICKYKTTK
ncbi:protein Star-like [Rhodnius prolixus]